MSPAPLLLTPGPTPIPERVRKILAEPILHHRTPEFQAAFAELKDQLRRFFQTEQDVLPLACTGTGAMEAAVVNLFSPGDTVLVINAGKFGERWSRIAETYGIRALELRLERGRALSLAQLKALIAQNPTAKAVLFQASETATGLKLPTRKIAALAREAGMLAVCDAITALGVFELPMDAWDLDVVITGSQKALMLPPGLAFIALSESAWKANAEARCPRFYFDLQRERRNHAKNQTAWTPATQLLLAANESLKIIFEEGLPARFARHARLAEATRRGVAALGLEVLAAESPSEAVTAVRVPASLQDGKAIPRLMASDHQVIIMGGQDELEGKIFRLSHFGDIAEADILRGLSALEATLRTLGHSHPSLTGEASPAVQAAQAFFIR